MRKHFFRKSTGDIIFNDTLEIINLNETAQFIYQGNSEGKSHSTIAYELSKKYNLPIHDALADTLETLQQLSDFGINTQQNISFEPHTVIMHILQNCNSPCKLCDCWTQKNKRLHKLKELQPVLVWLSKKQNKNIMVSGGEPLLHPEVDQICSEIKSLGMNVLLNTNGLLLHRNPWLNSKSVDELVVSMDGYNSDSYQSIRGINAYDRVWSNIQNLKSNDTQLKVSIRIILNKMNMFHLKDIFDQARKYGVYRIGISPLDISSLSFGRTTMVEIRIQKLTNQFLPNKSEIQEFRNCLNGSLGEFIDLNNINGLSDWSKDDFLRCMSFYDNENENQGLENSDTCLFPMSSLVIDYDGSMKPCFYANGKINLNNPEQYDEQFQNQIEELKTSGKCNHCRGKVFCDIRIKNQSI